MQTTIPQASPASQSGSATPPAKLPAVTCKRTDTVRVKALGVVQVCVDGRAREHAPGDEFPLDALVAKGLIAQRHVALLGQDEESGED